MSSDNDQTAPVQVRYVQAPAHYSPNVNWIGVSTGIVTAGLICGIGARYVINWTGLDHDDWLGILFYYVLAISVGGGLWGAYRHRAQWNEELGKAPGSRLRRRRLKLLARRNRLTHRKPRFALQWALLEHYRFNGDAWRVAASRDAGAAIAANFPPEYRFPRPVVHDHGFEPIEIDDPSEQMRGLMDMTFAAGGVDFPEPFDPPASSNAARAIQDRKRKPKSKDLMLHVSVLVIAIYLFLLVAPSFHWEFLLLVVISLAGRFGPSLADPRRWWLVPGSIVYREARSWRKKMQVGMVTPENSPLFVHYEEGYALVRVNTMTLRIGCPDWTGWCVLAAWISTAARPTKEEILAFFGPDAEWEGS